MDAVQIFELVYLMLAAYTVLHVAVSDLWVRHIFMHRTPCPGFLALQPADPNGYVKKSHPAG